MFRFGAYAGLELLFLVEHGISFVVLVMGLTVTRTHANMPSDIRRCIRSFLDLLVTRISKCNRLISVQEYFSLGNVTDMTGGSASLCFFGRWRGDVPFVIKGESWWLKPSGPSKYGFWLQQPQSQERSSTVNNSKAKVFVPNKFHVGQ